MINNQRTNPPLSLRSRTSLEKGGFTLVELLVVITIVSILTVISLGSYTSAQIKAKDSQRKSDLKSISESLMLYYNDMGSFPSLFIFGNSDVGFTGKNGLVYMRQTPIDPRNMNEYVYIYKVTPDLKAFNLFANLENKKDSQCETTPYVVDGTNYCYGISSPNIIVDPTQF